MGKNQYFLLFAVTQRKIKGYFWATNSQYRRNAMPHPKVQVVIFAASGQVLLLQTTTIRGAFWQNVTGSVESHEDYTAAAARELAEETSFTTPVRSAHYGFQFEHPSYQDPTQQEICTEQVFYTLLPTPQSPRLDPLEHQTFSWRNLTEVAAQDYKFATSWTALSQAYEICRREHPELAWPYNAHLNDPLPTQPINTKINV